MKKISLYNSNEEAIVDDDDFEYISQWEWFLTEDGYAAREELIDGELVTIYMHEVIGERMRLNSLSTDMGQDQHLTK